MIEYTDDMIKLRDEIHTDIFEYFQGTYVGWLGNIYNIFHTLYRDTMEDEKDYLSQVLTDEIVETWLQYPSVQLYFRAPNYSYEGARSSLRKYIRSKAINYVSKLNHKYEKETEAKYISFQYGNVSPNNESYDIKHPELFKTVCRVSGIVSADKMCNTLMDIFGKGMTVVDACAKNHLSKTTYYDNLTKIRNQKEEVSVMARNSGYYIPSELEEETYWSVEMMEEKYHMPKNKGINEGYYEQFKNS